MTELKTIKDRLLFFADTTDLTRAQFERKAGLSNGYLRNFKGSLGAQKLEDILNSFPELSRVWLLTGEGGMLNTNYPDPEPLTEFEKFGRRGMPDSNLFEALYNKESKEKDKLLGLLESQQQTIANHAATIAQLTESNNRLTLLLDGYKKVTTTAEAVGVLSTAALP